MKLLYVTTSYPPFMDMQTIRNIKLINRLVELGNEIIVVAPDANWLTFNKNEIFINSDVKVWRTKPPVFIKLQHFLSKHKLLKPISKVYNVLVNYILIPDIFASWSFVTKRAIKYNIAHEHFDAVITSSGGYSAHFIGNWIEKKFQICWIADYGDPWGLDIYGNKKRIFHFFERKLLKNCSGLFFTTQSTIDAYISNFNLDNLKVFKLPCGFDYFPISKQLKNNQDCFLVTYTGVAYKLSRNLSNAVIALSNLSELGVKFKIVGSYSEKFVNLANSLNATNIDFHGKVNFETSLEIIFNADLLLHIGNFGSMQIPGKTYIYLGTPKPILYIKQELENDPTLSLIKQFKGVVISENNSKSIENSIKEILNNYDYYLRLSIERVNSKELAEYSWTSIGDYFNNCIKDILT